MTVRLRSAVGVSRCQTSSAAGLGERVRLINPTCQRSRREACVEVLDWQYRGVGQFLDVSDVSAQDDEGGDE